jgi:hypothetical protein
MVIENKDTVAAGSEDRRFAIRQENGFKMQIQFPDGCVSERGRARWRIWVY